MHSQLSSYMGVAQLVGGLLSGPLADRFGARTLFAASFVASALCYSAVALSSGMVGLYLSRVPTLLQHAMLAARALIAERTDSESRARWLGFVGVAYAVGAAIGPAAGGAIGSVSLPLAAWVSAAGSALSVVIILAAMPSRGQRAVDASVAAAATPTPGEELPADSLAPQDAPSAPAGNSADTQQKDGTSKQGNVGASSASMAAAFARVWRTPRVPSLLTGKLLSSLPSATFRVVFPLIALRAYGMDVQAQGLCMSVMGASAAFSQAVVVGWSEVRSCRQARGCAPSRAPPGVCARRFAAPMRGLTRLCRRQCHQRFHERTVTATSAALLAASFIALACTSTLPQLLVVVVPIIMSGAVLGNLQTAQLTRAVAASESGTVIAVDMSIGSLLSIVTPAAGTALFETGGLGALAAAGCALYAALAALVATGVLAA